MMEPLGKPGGVFFSVLGSGPGPQRGLTPTPRRTVGKFGGSGDCASEEGASIASVLLSELDVAVGLGGGISASATLATSAADRATGELNDAAVMLCSAEAASVGAGLGTGL